MAEKKLRDEDIARAIGRSRVAVNRWRRDIQRPNWQAIEALRVFSHGKITADDWRFLAPSEAAE